MIYFILTVCLCLMIDAIYVMYLYNKTDNFIYQKDREAKKLEQNILLIVDFGALNVLLLSKKIQKFDGLRRKLGGA